MTQAISHASASGFAAELAVLQLDIEANQSESARLQRDAARDSYTKHAEQQVDALHAAADATLTGALLSASLTAVSGACQIGAAQFQYDAEVARANGGSALGFASDTRTARVFGELGKALGNVAEPVGTLVGGSSAAHHQAEAKRQELLAEQAKWRASDASSSLDKADHQSDQVLDLLQGIQQGQRAADMAITGRI